MFVRAATVWLLVACAACGSRVAGPPRAEQTTTVSRPASTAPTPVEDCGPAPMDPTSTTTPGVPWCHRPTTTGPVTTSTVPQVSTQTSVSLGGGRLAPEQVPWVLPMVLPDGLELWATYSTRPHFDAGFLNAPGGARLIRRGSDGRTIAASISVTMFPVSGAGDAGTVNAVVHGQPASLLDTGDGTLVSLSWVEHDQRWNVSANGISGDELVAMSTTPRLTSRPRHSERALRADGALSPCPPAGTSSTTSEQAPSPEATGPVR